MRKLSLALTCTAAAMCGCAGDVETTDDAVEIEAEIPKVETGEEELDLDPGTDDDLDIETPEPGDS